MSVELQIQAQIDSIAATQVGFSTAMASRNPNRLWLLIDAAADIPYENRVKGSAITQIDQAVQTADIGVGFFQNWFQLHNNYYASDNPITNVTTLKAAIEGTYRWRVSAFFNQVALSAAGQGFSIAPGNVFPSHLLNLGGYTLTNGTTGTFTKGNGPVDSIKIGPGIVSAVVSNDTIGGSNVTMAVTCVYEDSTTVQLQVVVTNGSTVGAAFLIGGQVLTGSYTAATDVGVARIAATAAFKEAQKVLIIESTKSEVAVITSISNNVSLTLQGLNNTVPGLRNDYTTSAKVYPLFVDISAVTNSTGTALDEVVFQFAPDRTIVLN